MIRHRHLALTFLRKRKIRGHLKHPRIILSRVGILLPALLLGACAAISPANRLADAVNAPNSWSASPQSTAGIDRNWIQKIGGSTLRNLVTQALGNNFDLQAAAARVDRAASEARIAGAGRLPSLGFGTDARRNKQNFIGFPFGGAGGGVPSNISQQFGVNLNAAWELDVWGRAKAGQEASIATAEARKYEYLAAQVSLAGQVTKAYLALAEANEQIALAQKAVSATSTLADAVQERFERAILDDGGSASQVRLTASEVESRKSALAERQQEHQRALRQLEILLGTYPSGTLPSSAKLPAFPGPTPSGLPSELLLRRPDILAAERDFASASRRVKEAKLARFPSLSLTASGGTTSDSIRDILKSDFGVWAIGANLTQPIFQGGEITENITKNEATLREQTALLQKAVLEAFGEVEQALIAEGFLARRVAAGRKAVNLATEAAVRAGEEFAGGTGDVLTLIDATQRELDSKSQLTALRRLRLENRTDLHLALAGDFKLHK